MPAFSRLERIKEPRCRYLEGLDSAQTEVPTVDSSLRRNAGLVARVYVAMTMLKAEASIEAPRFSDRSRIPRSLEGWKHRRSSTLRRLASPSDKQHTRKGLSSFEEALRREGRIEITLTHRYLHQPLTTLILKVNRAVLAAKWGHSVQTKWLRSGELFNRRVRSCECHRFRLVFIAKGLRPALTGARFRHQSPENARRFARSSQPRLTPFSQGVLFRPPQN